MIPAGLEHLGGDGLEVALERLGMADELGTPAGEALAVAVREGEAADAGGSWSELSPEGRALIDTVSEAFGGVRITRWAWKGARPPASPEPPERRSREPAASESSEPARAAEAEAPRPVRRSSPPAVPVSADLLDAPVG